MKFPRSGGSKAGIKPPVKSSLDVSAPDPSVSALPAGPAFPRRFDGARKDRPSTLTLRIADSGEPLWGKLSDRTRELWKEVLSHDESKKYFGSIEGKAPEEPALPIVPAETVASWLDIMAAIQARVAAWRFKIPVETAGHIFKYQDAEKAQLIPPSQRVLAKYGPDFLAKYGDEVTLLSLFATGAYARFHVCGMVAAKMRAEEAAKKKANGEVAAPVVETKDVFGERPLQ